MSVKSLFNKIFNIKKDNKGSAIVTVLVAFLFISVLVTMLLSSVVVNYRMRSIDRRTKDEFYYAEKALNDIYTGLGQDCSAIIGTSYNNVLKNYQNTASAGTYSYTDQENAYKAFVETYITIFKSTIANNTTDRFNTYIVKDTQNKALTAAASRAKAELVSPGSIKYYKSGDRNASDLITDLNTDAAKVRCIVIEDVCVSSNDDARENAGYVSAVNTDIVINIPWVDFFNLNQASYDMALIANHGLYFENNSTVNIKGNVFGGTFNYGNIISDKNNIYDSSQYGGINVNGANVTISEAEYIVSGGDINVCRGDVNNTPCSGSVQNGRLTIKSSGNMNNQIWFENLSVKGDESVVNIEGTLFAASDTQIDGDKADVTIKGSYFGYNNEDPGLSMTANGNRLTTKEAIFKSNSSYKNAIDSNTENPAARSSSIIVNGHGDKVDLTGLNTLMLMGDAYINHEADKDSRNKINNIYTGSERDNKLSSTRDISVNDSNAKITDSRLSESVALKASQSILYVPTMFIDKPNPTQYTQYEGDPFTVAATITTSDWFGAKYINATTNHKTVKLKEGTNSYYAYCYLNFKDGTIPAGSGFPAECVGLSYKDGYITEVILGNAASGETEPTAATIKGDIMAITMVYDSDVAVNDASGNQRVYSKGAILEYDSAASELKIMQKTPNIDVFDGYSSNLYRRYRMLDTYMEPLRDVPLSSGAMLADIDKQDLLSEGNEMPFARYFWLWGLRKAVELSATEDYDYLAYNENGVWLVLVRVKTDKVFDLSQVKDASGNPVFNGKTNAVVLIDGDTEVRGSVSINGFVASQGRITVREDATFNVTYDSAIINRRISTELEELAANGGYDDSKSPENNDTARKWLIYYLLKTDASTSFESTSPYKLKCTGNNMANTHANASRVVTGYRLYQYVDTGAGGAVANPVNTDYTSYMYFDNWRKGQR